MVYRWLTDVTVTVHLAFLLFVVAGGVLTRRYRWMIAPHLLCVTWAVYVEATPGLVCPLTPLENYFAMRAGSAGYEGSFIEHYLVPIIYPDGLTPALQLTSAGAVLGLNVAVYGWSPVRRHLSRARTAAKNDEV
jgi:hypothetical protein